MKQWSIDKGVIVDIIVAVLYALILPHWIDQTMQQPDKTQYAVVAIAALVMYPLLCLSMLHKFKVEPRLHEGVCVLHRILWKFYTWPLGILFWLSLIAHGVTLSLTPIIIFHTIYENTSACSTDYFYPFWLSSLIINIAIGVYILARIKGLTFGKVIESLRNWWREVSIVWIVVLSPLYLVFFFLILTIIVILPFVLYVMIWGYATYAITNGQSIPAVLPERKSSDVFLSIIIILYSIVVNFVINVAFSLQPVYQPWWTMGRRIATTLFFIFYLYLPYRVFFALDAGKRFIGWMSFVVTFAVIVYQTWRRLTPLP